MICASMRYLLSLMRQARFVNSFIPCFNIYLGRMWAEMQRQGG